MKKVIVFGGSGFIGSHVADSLSEKNYEVTIFDSSPSKWLGENQRQIIEALATMQQQLNFSFQQDLKNEQEAFNYFLS